MSTLDEKVRICEALGVKLDTPALYAEVVKKHTPSRGTVTYRHVYGIDHEKWVGLGKPSKKQVHDMVHDAFSHGHLTLVDVVVTTSARIMPPRIMDHMIINVTFWAEGD